MTTLRNVRILDLDTGGKGEPVDVVFDGSITAIEAAAGDRHDSNGGGVIDGEGKLLLPGLIDTHVHLGSPEALVRSARAGVTTMVDLGTSSEQRIKEQRGGHGATTVLSAGSAASAPGSTQIAGMGFAADSGVTGPDDAERFLDWRMQNDSDLIKIIIEDPAATDVPALDVATISALVNGAHERGLLTVAHVVTADAFDRGLDAGVDILTHAPLDRVLPDSTLQRMLDQKTIASPTLVMMRRMATARLGERAEAAFANALQSVRGMHEAGIPIVVGTDANETPFASVPHGCAVHDEMGYLRQSGLEATDVLRAATCAASDAYGLSDRGSVSVGRRADLVLADGDPLMDPTCLREPGSVWISGVKVV